MPREYRVISGDSHIEVPSDFWTSRVPARYRDQAPRRITLSNGGTAHTSKGAPLVFGGTNHYSGKSPETFDPTIAEDWTGAVGSGDPAQRLSEQDRDGVDAELLFSSNSVMRVARAIKDTDAYRAVIRAYNEYLAEYCSAAPDRLLSVGLLPHRGLEHDIEELEHCKDIGINTVVLGEYPAGKSYPTPEDDRFWSRALDLQMPLCVHPDLHLPDGPRFVYPTEPEGERAQSDFFSRLIMRTTGHAAGLEAAQMVMTGVFLRFPDLQIYWAENGIGWLPYFCEQMDLEWSRNHYWAERLYGVTRLDRLPSEYLKEHSYWGFFDDPVGLRLRHDIGVDRIIFGSDFPHVVSTWPDSREILNRELAGATDAEKHKILAQNLLDFLHLDATAEADGARSASQEPTRI